MSSPIAISKCNIDFENRNLLRSLYTSMHPQQSDLTNVKALLRRDAHWTGYVRVISSLLYHEHLFCPDYKSL